MEKSNKKYKAVLFDLDGTLLDTLHDLASSMNEVLKLYDFPVHQYNAYKKMVGDGVEMMVERALPPEKRDEQTVRDCVSRMREEYSKRWDAVTAPYPGVEKMLNGLSDMGIRMSIFSNKPDDFTKLTVSGLLPGWNFEHVLGIREGIPKKPEPDAAIEIAGRMSLSAGEFIYLGDTATDMKTAVAAGMFPVGVLWGFRDADELLENGARELLASPEDIFNLL